MANYKKEDLPNLVGREFESRWGEGCYTLLSDVESAVSIGKGGNVMGVYLKEDFIKCYELLPEIPEGFTRHFGGECPVDADVRVKMVYRDGEENGAFHPQIESWSHDGTICDIIAYRVIEQEKPKELDISEYWQVVYTDSHGVIWVSKSMYQTKEIAAAQSQHGCKVIGYKQVGSNIVELV